jgi:hypothetical protein
MGSRRARNYLRCALIEMPVYACISTSTTLDCGIGLFPCKDDQGSYEDASYNSYLDIQGCLQVHHAYDVEEKNINCGTGRAPLS